MYCARGGLLGDANMDIHPLMPNLDKRYASVDKLQRPTIHKKEKWNLQYYGPCN